MTCNKSPQPRRTQDLDEIDRKILALLETDARRPIADIARAVSLTGPGTSERIARMRDRGIIRGFRVDLDPGKLGLHVSAFIEFEPHSNADAAGIAAVAGHHRVRSCYKVTGVSMMVLTVNARDGAELHNILLEFAKHGSTRTAIILSSELADLPYFADRPSDVVAALLKPSRSPEGG